MASFTEQATLKVNDQSSAAIRKINAELKKLDATAKALKSTRINIRVNVTGLAQANAQLRALQSTLNSLRTARVNLNVNTGGIQRAQNQINRLRAAAARPINVNVGGGGGGGPGAGAGAGGRGRGMRQTGIQHQFGNFSALRGASSVLIGGTAYAIGATIARAIGEGIKEVDTGETSLMLKQLDRVYGARSQLIAEGMVTAAQHEAQQMTGGAFWGMGQRLQNFSEALGMAPGKDLGRPGRGRPSGLPEYRPALAVTAQLEEMARTLVGLGQSSERANEQALNFAKGLEQTGRFTDRLTSQFDATKMAESFDYFRQLAPSIGKEFSGDFARQMIKYLSTEKYTVSNRALGAVMLMGEEMGTRAAVGYHQAVKQLSGQGQKKAQLGFMMEEGLLQTAGYKTVGKGKRAKQVPIVGSVVDEDLLREDLPQWIDKHLVPILEKRGRAEGQKLVESGEISSTQLDAYIEKYKTDPNKIAALAYKVVGDRTAVETIAGFLERSQEIQRSLNEVAMRSGKPEDIRKATQFSINIATAQLQNQFKGAMGTMAHAAAPWLVPQMQRASGEFSKISTEFRDSLAQGKTPLNAMERLSNIMTPLALGAAVASAVSDPRNAPAAMASIGLITAGNLLIRAANKLYGTPEGAGSPFGAVPATPEGVSLQDYQRQLAVKEKELRDARTVDTAQEGNIAQLRKYVEREEAANRTNPNRPITARARDTYAIAVQKIQEFEQQTAERNARIAQLQTEVNQLKAQVERAVYEATTGKEYDEKTRLYYEARRAEAQAAEAERLRIKAMTPAQRKAHWAAVERARKAPGYVPMPIPRPPDIVEDPVPVKVVPPEPTPDQLPPPPPPPPPLPPELTPPLKVEPVVPGGLRTTPPPPLFLPGFPGTFGGGGAVTPIVPQPLSNIIDVDDAKVQFASFFDSGATTIGASGTEVGSKAGSELSGQAGAIGGAIGRAAASIISQATVNIQIPGQGGGTPSQGNRGDVPVPA